MRALRHILALLACTLSLTASYAVQIRPGSGKRIPEHIIPTDRDNPALWAPQSVTKGAAPGQYAIRDITRTGTLEIVLVLVDFIDKPFSIKDTSALLNRFEQLYNMEGYKDDTEYFHNGTHFKGASGSATDYFKAQSNGQFTLKFNIVGPIHPAKGYAYYGEGYNDSRISTLIREVCDTLATNGIVDLKEYTRDGNIDHLSIIYAGNGENYDGADRSTIWPRADILGYNKNGIKDIKYTVSCELYWDSDTIIDGIGTFCHEFSHTLGLPDFYNVNSASDTKANIGMGYWSLMDFGNYENEGFSPVGYTAFEKYSLGWMDLEDITAPGNYTLHNISYAPDPDNGIHTAYRLNTLDDDQFIILENHTRTGWYQYHQAEGLMITTVNYDSYSWHNKNVNGYTTKRYRIFPADNDYTWSTCAGDLFPYQDIDSATTLGTPTLCVSGSFPPYSIYNISLKDSLVTFYAGLDMPTRIARSSAPEISISLDGGLLSVTAPVDSKVTIHDLSGKQVMQVITSEVTEQIELPGHGIWLVKCGNRTKKVSL